MPGLLIRVPDSFNNPELPLLRPDGILPQTGGLLLLDVAHPASDAVTLETGSPLTNLAAEQAATLLDESAAALDAELTFAGVTPDTPSAIGLIELSGKGGIHSILVESHNTTGNGIKILPPQAVVDHMVDNPDHDYFVSLWCRLTRVTTNGNTWSVASFSATPGTGELLYSISSGTTWFPDVSKRLGYRAEPNSFRSSDGITAPQPAIRNFAVSEYTGTVAVSGSTARGQFKVWSVGKIAPFEGSNPQPAGIFYRYYLEDLSVSGRTYAEVDAIDHALYTEHVLTPGGRYYGDTFTDPATVT